MTLVRYEPFGMLRKFHDELNRQFDANAPSHDWSPAVDIRALDDHYVLTADVPGVEPKDIEITMNGRVLTIKGERHSESENDTDGYRRVERVRGSFSRSFTLPESVDAEGIEAKGNNGVLEVRIPKPVESQPRRIQVH